jgi:hypothetical protein
MSRHQSAGQTYNFTIANKSCPCDQLSTTPWRRTGGVEI